MILVTAKARLSSESHSLFVEIPLEMPSSKVREIDKLRRRWLTHSISDYYGLESRSVMLTNPSRKVVFVGLKKVHQRDGLSMKHFPRPMWQLC
jgi:hypothetical protein